jgi:putative transposase
LPRAIVCDNGPGFAGQDLDQWAHTRMTLQFIQPGKPVQNAFESFNGRLRDECLNDNWFVSLETLGKRSKPGAKTTTRSGPHCSLDDRTPEPFAMELLQASTSLTPISGLT